MSGWQRYIAVTVLLVASQVLHGQVQIFHKEFNNVWVPYNPPSGKTISFAFDYQGKITQFWWGFSASGWRDLHIRYTLPSGAYIEQIPGEPWISVDPVIGEEISGLW